MSEWLTRYLASVDEMRLGDYLAFFTDDAKFRFANNPRTTGKPAIHAGISAIFGMIAGIRHDIEKVWETDDAILFEGDCTYTRKDGSRVTVPFATIARRRDGLIHDGRIFIDIAPLFAAPDAVAAS